MGTNLQIGFACSQSSIQNQFNSLGSFKQEQLNSVFDLDRSMHDALPVSPAIFSHYLFCLLFPCKNIRTAQPLTKRMDKNSLNYSFGLKLTRVGPSCSKTWNAIQSYLLYWKVTTIWHKNFVATPIKILASIT